MSDPRTAFAFRAFAMAMKARARALRPAEALDLSLAWADMVPGDSEAAMAVLRFQAGLRGDGAAAGAALHDFLVGWCDAGTAAQADRAEDRLVAFDALPPRYDWQERKDICG